jgi:high-affinity iron transporter
MAREMRAVGAEVSAGERPLVALALVVGVAVLREGSEVVLFLYGIAASGGLSVAAMLAGGTLGVVAGAGICVLMYLGLLTIPPSRLFAATAGLITLLAAGLAAQAIAFIQQAGDAEVLTAPVWDTSWLLSGDSLLGRLMHTLVGYTDQPSGAQLAAYVATVVMMIALMRLVAPRKPTVAAVAIGSD